MLRNKLYLFALPFICACTTPVQPGIQIQTQEVKVPVSVPCTVKIPDPPAYNFDALPPPKSLDDIFPEVQALTADRLLSKGYEAELLAALTACTK